MWSHGVRHFVVPRERRVDCGDDIGFVQLSRRVHLLAEDLDDARALLGAAVHETVDLA